MNSRTNSTAVMARRIEPASSLDFFPTPPWATRAFCEFVLPCVYQWPDLFDGTACDPACGEGHMAAVLGEYFTEVTAADIFEYGYGATADFTHPDWTAPGEKQPDWIVTNPPFNRAAEFVQLALKRARRGVAILARTAFQEGEGRYDELFQRQPPQLVAQYVERVPMHRGRWVINGNTATAYQWFVWLVRSPHDWLHTRLMWIPKSRKALHRSDDWLRFGGCVDLPKEHRAMKLMEADGVHGFLSLDEIRARQVQPMAVVRQVEGALL